MHVLRRAAHLSYQFRAYDSNHRGGYSPATDDRPYAVLHAPAEGGHAPRVCSPPAAGDAGPSGHLPAPSSPQDGRRAAGRDPRFTADVVGRLDQYVYRYQGRECGPDDDPRGPDYGDPDAVLSGRWPRLSHRHGATRSVAKSISDYPNCSGRNQAERRGARERGRGQRRACRLLVRRRTGGQLRSRNGPVRSADVLSKFGQRDLGASWVRMAGDRSKFMDLALNRH